MFHSIPLPSTKHVFRILDYCIIYVLIAGTCKPFTLVTLREPWGCSLSGTVCGLALIGIVFKMFTTGRFDKLSLAVYLVMGWCLVVAIKPLVAALAPCGRWRWLPLAGGLSYSVVTIFYRWQSLRYHHAIWRLFVLGYYFAVLLHVMPDKA